MIKAIKFVSVPVRDQDKAVEFYTKKLGFAVHTDQPFNDKQRWVELRIPGAETHLVLFTMEGQEEKVGTQQPMAFVWTNVKKSYQDLSSRGVEFVTPPQGADWGEFAVFKDQDGNQFVLSSK